MAIFYHAYLGYRYFGDSLCHQLYRPSYCQTCIRVKHVPYMDWNTPTHSSLPILPVFSLYILLSAAESGYIPGIMYLLSKFYKPAEFSFRVSILLTMATLSGLLSGPLAYSMSYFDGLHGMHDWQYLFIFEGVPTIALAFVSYFTLFDDLQVVGWLTPEQKILQANRMIEHQSNKSTDSSIGMNTMKIVFYDWKTWAFSLVFLLNAINITSLGVFAPTLINGNI
jgi:sugar phosphate permease